MTSIKLLPPYLYFGNSTYVKKAGENGLISLNPKYPPLIGGNDRIMVLGKAEDN